MAGDDENPMRDVQALAAEMAARHGPDPDMRARFLEECRALGLDPDTQKITPLMYALAVAGGGSSKRSVKKQ